jgi:hypothetical protein
MIIIINPTYGIWTSLKMVLTPLTLNRGAIKIYVAVRLEVIYDFSGDQ